MHRGSAKSTILQLILRFYNAKGEQIFLDEIVIQILNPCWIHRVISIVQQEPIVFTMPIRDNILYDINDFVLMSEYGISNLDAALGNSRIDNGIQNCLQLVQASYFANLLQRNIQICIYDCW